MSFTSQNPTKKLTPTDTGNTRKILALCPTEIQDQYGVFGKV